MRARKHIRTLGSNSHVGNMHPPSWRQPSDERLDAAELFRGLEPQIDDGHMRHKAGKPHISIAL